MDEHCMSYVHMLNLVHYIYLHTINNFIHNHNVIYKLIINYKLLF